MTRIDANTSPEDRRRLVARLLRERRARTVQETRPVAAAASDKPSPLSFAQERLWFLHQLDPESPAYNAKYSCRLRGPLQINTLEAAINAIVDRHAVLRTIFPMVDGRAAAVAHARLAVPLDLVDLALVPPFRQAAERQALAVRASRRPFELSRGPLLRVLLLHLGRDDHQLILVAHHIVADGWALGLFLDELSAAYRSLRAGGEPVLPALPLQYADYAAWHREQVEHGALASQLAYWRRQLDGDVRPLTLPADHARSAVGRDAGGVHRFELGPEVSRQVHQLAAGAGLSVYMVLLAAYEIALYWLSGQTDFAIACPIANRHRTETERLIGFFVNTLVMRARVEREMTRGELLCQVRDTALGAYAHQDAPFEWVVRELRPERSLDVNPLCRVLFVLQNVPDGSLCLDGVAVEPVALETQTTRFDVELIITIQAGVVSGRFVYSLALFTPSTAERMLRTYVTAVTGLVEASTRTVSDIERALSSERIASTQAGSDELQRVAMAMLASVLRARS